MPFSVTADAQGQLSPEVAITLLVSKSELEGLTSRSSLSDQLSVTTLVVVFLFWLALPKRADVDLAVDGFTKEELSWDPFNWLADLMGAGGMGPGSSCSYSRPQVWISLSKKSFLRYCPIAKVICVSVYIEWGAFTSRWQYWSWMKSYLFWFLTRFDNLGSFLIRIFQFSSLLSSPYLEIAKVGSYRKKRFFKPRTSHL